MIILDVEASGVNFNLHSVVSIGAFDFDNPEDRFYAECRVWDGAHIDDGALEVNGFTKEEILDETKKSEGEITADFFNWIQDKRDWTIVGQNPSFDRDFMRTAAERAHLEFPLAYRTIDTHTLAYMHMIKQGITPPFDTEHHRTALNLDAVLNYVGIPEEPHPHNALTGALCHGEVASRLLYDRMLLPEFTQYAIPWQTPLEK